jgi:hypothetical protein
MKARAELGIEGDDSDESGMSLMSDEELKKEEGEERGRKGLRKKENERKRSESKIKNRAGENSDMMRKQGNKLGDKRKASTHQDDIEMGSDEEDHGISKHIRGSLGKMNRSMTPAQRKISAKKILRDRTASRREGS